VVLNHISVKEFIKAGAAIKVYGGDNRADSLKIQNCSSEKIEVGSGVEDISIDPKE
jgi:hypothetical protein